MTTLWAIEVTPRRGKPWIDYSTVSRRRYGAWAAYLDGSTAAWHRETKRRQRKGLLRAVKVTIQVAKEQS